MDAPDLATAFSSIKAGDYSSICEYEKQIFVCNSEPTEPDPIYYGYKDGDEDLAEDFKTYEAQLDTWDSMGETL